MRGKKIIWIHAQGWIHPKTKREERPKMGDEGDNFMYKANLDSQIKTSVRF